MGSNLRGRYIRLFSSLALSLSILVTPHVLWAQQGQLKGVLETPAPGSFQSGVGLIRGWICSASRVDIEVVGRASSQAVYGEPRGDTQVDCGDTNNGFSIQFNWNELGEGTHTVRVLADGTEFGRAQVIVATLGQAFLQGAQGEFPVSPFPQDGQQTRIRWQESRQSFVITNGGTPASGGVSPRADAKLEDPQPGSFQSGIGPIRGWVCNASRVEIELDGRAPVPAVYGQPRGDTQRDCGDTNNGFSLQVNWNDVGDGAHTIRVLADGVEVGTATFTVVTLGLGSFPKGLNGDFLLDNFSQTGRQTEVRWQESQQNFVITGARFPGISEAQCLPQTGQALDGAGGRAQVTLSNPCLLSGNMAVLNFQALQSAALTQEEQGREARTAEGGAFRACATNLTIEQGGKIFGAESFRLVDFIGQDVCVDVSPGGTLDALLQALAQSDLNFNAPFTLRYTNQVVITIPEPLLGFTVSPEEVTFSNVAVGASEDKTFIITNTSGAQLVGGMTLIAAGSGGNVFTLVSDDTLSIEPGQSQTVTVRYTAMDNTPTTGSVRISTNGGVKSVVLRAGGDSGEPLPLPQLIVQQTSLDFGQVQVGQTDDQTLTVINNGGGTLTGSINTSAPFSIVGGDSFSLGVGQRQTVTVRVTGTTAGPVSDTATVTSNGGASTVTLSATVEAPGTNCGYTLNPTVPATVPAAGGTGAVSVSTTPTTGCNWTAVSNAPWITITSESSGSGNGTVNYTVAPNPEASARTGTLTVEGQTVTVTQTGVPCSYTVEPTDHPIDDTGGPGSVTVTASSGCSWTAVSNAPWITITSESRGSGNGTVNYTVPPNPEASARTGTLTVEGQTVTVTQAGAATNITACPYRIDSPGQYRLAADLSCSTGDGIGIGASDVDLNLNGHTISGPGSGCGGSTTIGIAAGEPDDSNVHIHNGTVTGFYIGIQIAGHDHHANGLTVMGNCEGIRVSDSDNNQINGNNASGNFLFGVLVNNSNDNEFNSNVANNTGGVCCGGGGFFLVNSHGNIINSNDMSDNQNNLGLWLTNDSQNNIIRGNTANRNSQQGIRINSGSTENLIQGNRASGNGGGDLMDLNVPACINTWTSNTFVTDNEPGADLGPGAGCIQ